jgi:hypothetical protein
MNMHTEFIIFSIVITVVAIEMDKITQFTHPTLHVVALAGLLSVVYSVAMVV